MSNPSEETEIPEAPAESEGHYDHTGDPDDYVGDAVDDPTIAEEDKA